MASIRNLVNKDTQIWLTQSLPDVQIALFYNGVAASFQTVYEKWPEIGALREYFRYVSVSRCEVPIEALDRVRETFFTLEKENIRYSSKLHFKVDEAVQSLVVMKTPPADFAVSYRLEGNQLNRILPGSVTETKEGWFLRGNCFWRFEKLGSDLLPAFQRKSVPPEFLLSYTRDYFPVFRDAGVAIQSDIEYKDVPTVLMTLHDVSYDCIHLKPVWSAAPERFDDNIAIPGYAVAAGCLQPGLTPSDLRNVFSDLRADTILSGEQVAWFLDCWYESWKNWIRGETDEFERIHHWISKPYHWILHVQSVLLNGVGKPMAQPVACIGKERVRVADLVRTNGKGYIHFSSGWVPRDDLNTLGLDDTGTHIFKASSAPFALNAEQLVYHGNPELGDLWRGMVVDGPGLSVSSDKHSNAERLLEYLVYWGLNGGLIGGYECFVSYGVPFIASHLKNNKECRILIAGGPEDIIHLKQIYSKSKTSGTIALEPFEKAAQKPELMNAEWDIVILIEPDLFMPFPSQREMIKKIACVRARCVLCFPFEADSGRVSSEKDQWISGILGYSENQNLYSVLLQNCRTMKEVLRHYTFPGQLSVKELYAESQTLFASDGTAENPFPDRSSAQGKPAADQQTREPEKAAGSRKEPSEKPAAKGWTADPGEEKQDVPLKPAKPGDRDDFGRTIRGEAKTAGAPQIILDGESIKQLRDESDKVRDALISSVAKDNESEESDGLPYDTPENSSDEHTADPDLKIGLDASSEDNPEEQDHQLASGQPTPKWRILSDGLEPEWLVFFQSVDLAALAAAMQGKDELRRFARIHGTMPDVICDELNQKADDAIGDLILDEDGVFTEYAELIAEHMTEV